MTKAKTLINQLDEVAVYRWVRGNSLSPENQKKALSMYVHRYTGEHKPNWVKDYMPNGKEYPVQHETDQDWLANTEFAIKKNGDFDGRVRYSRSSPTWPKNPELRRDI